MSVDDSNSRSADDSADTPAELAPDEPTAVHDVPEPVTDDPADDPTVLRDIPSVPGVGEPSVAEEITSEPAVSAPPVVPPTFPPVVPTFPPVAEPEPVAGASPQLTSSGFPNPHGLPEIAVERPEVAIGAAFAGGLVVAMILKRLAR